MKERRVLRGENVRRLCIEKSWYARGNNEEYIKVLKLADCDDVTTKLIVKIAEDIKARSDTEYDVANICFEIARICYSFFEKEKD